MPQEIRVERFGGDWFHLKLYSTNPLIQNNGRIPERVVARGQGYV